MLLVQVGVSHTQNPYNFYASLSTPGHCMDKISGTHARSQEIVVIIQATIFMAFWTGIDTLQEHFKRALQEHYTGLVLYKGMYYTLLPKLPQSLAILLPYIACVNYL